MNNSSTTTLISFHSRTRLTGKITTGKTSTQNSKSQSKKSSDKS